MSITVEDTSFLSCGICGVYPVRVFADVEQYACFNGHFICGPCSCNGESICNCGKKLRLVSEPDEEFTRVAPYYAKRFIKSCDHCDFYTANQNVLDAHQTISCVATSKVRPSTDNLIRTRGKSCVYPKPNTYTHVHDAPINRLTVVFTEVDVVVDFVKHLLEVRTRGGPAYVVVGTPDSFFFAVFSDEDYVPVDIRGAILHSKEIRITVGSVFSKIPNDPFVETRDTQRCRQNVVAWQRTTESVLRDSARLALLGRTEFKLPDELELPIGVWRGHVRGFEALSRRLMKEDYRGGLLYYVRGTSPTTDMFINGFFLFIADSASGDSAIICPGCFCGYNFTLASSSICEHLRIHPKYIIENAVRVDVDSGMFLGTDGMTSCMRRVHAASFENEIRPFYERRRDDLLPMHARLHLPEIEGGSKHEDVYYGVMIAIGGRNRLVSVAIQTMDAYGGCDEFESQVQQFVRCTMCECKIVDLPRNAWDVCSAIGAHFKLDRGVIGTMGLMSFDMDKIVYSINAAHSIREYPALK